MRSITTAGIRSGFFVEPSRFLVKHIVVTAFGSLAVPWRAPSSAVASGRAFVTALALTVLAASSLLIWRRGDPRFARAVRLALWVIAAVAPVYSYFYVNTQLEGARYLYLAECGWTLLVVDLIWTVTGELPFDAFARPIIVTTMLVVSMVTLRQELSVWIRGADLRDRVLAEARVALERARCSAPVFDKAPDSLDGIYVFRNGLREALQLQ